MEPYKILIFCPNWVGDMAMALPAIRAVRETHPDAHVTLWMREYVRPIVEGAPWHDEILTPPAGRSDKKREEIRDAVRLLREKRFDLALILPHSFRTAWIAWRAKIPVRVGLARQGRGLLLTHKVKPKREKGKVVPDYMVHVYARILEAAGIPLRNPRIEMFPTPQGEAKADRILGELLFPQKGPLIGFNPGAAFGASKCWPTSHFSELGNLLKEKLDARILIFCGPKERPVAEEINERMGRWGAIVGPPQSDLNALKSIINRLDLLVTNDTGPRHIALAFDTPAVVLIGPMDPRYGGAPSEPNAVSLREPVECAPCNLPVCPIDHRCMTRITPHRVYEAIVERLSRTTPNFPQD